MNKLFLSKKDCCCCTACTSICPKHAISLQPDEEGFLYPHVNEKLCVKCGLCNEVCAFQNGYSSTADYQDVLKVYAAKHRQEEVRASSSSGGMFSIISDEILIDGGVIYGAGFNDHLVVTHQRVEDEDGRNKLRGSKYVQSDLRHVFINVESDLSDGREVLFTGTPCQIAGLKKYLDQKGADSTKLFLCDLVCHGTSSPLIFAEYLKFCEAKHGQAIINYFFRTKERGWHTHTEKSVYANGDEDYKSFLSQINKNIFYSHLALRPACHSCRYTNLKRPSDLTIGDYWGIDRTMPDFDDNKGISLVLVNSPKGQELFEKIKRNVEFRASNVQDCLQPQLKHPVKPSPRRDEFWQDFTIFGFEYVAKKYAGYGVRGIIRQFIVSVVRRLGLATVIRNIIPNTNP